MKNEFFEYFPKSEKDIQALWENSLIVFDASFLLNIYRYSMRTKDELIKVMRNLSDRLWIPHQACYEFLRNRLTVIADQVKIYDDSISEIKKLKNAFNGNMKNPFIENKLFDEFVQKTDEIIKALDDKKKEYSILIDSDKYLVEITDLFTDKVGKPFSEEENENIIKKGKTRFEKRIPPGYEDAKKNEPDCYGDLFVWKQLIKKSKESIMNVLFITDDLKNDWWEIFQGKRKGPRVELIREFEDESKMKFHMYSGDMFLRYSNEYMKQKVSEDSITEVNTFNIYIDNVEKEQQKMQDYFTSRTELNDIFTNSNSMQDFIDSQKAMRDALSIKNPMQDFIDSQKAIRDVLSIKNPMQDFIDSQKAMFDVLSIKNPMQDFIDSQKAMRDVLSIKNPMQDFIDSQKAMFDVLSIKNPMQDFIDSQKAMFDVISFSKSAKKLENLESKKLDKIIDDSNQKNGKSVDPPPDSDNPK